MSPSGARRGAPRTSGIMRERASGLWGARDLLSAMGARPSVRNALRCLLGTTRLRLGGQIGLSRALVQHRCSTAGSQATRRGRRRPVQARGNRDGVAATKTFVARVPLVYALALRLADVSGTLPAAKLSEPQPELEPLPGRIDEVVRSVEEGVRELAQRLAWSPFFPYLGRLSGLPVATYRGRTQLRLNEISYVPATLTRGNGAWAGRAARPRSTGRVRGDRGTRAARSCCRISWRSAPTAPGCWSSSSA